MRNRAFLVLIGLVVGVVGIGLLLAVSPTYAQDTPPTPQPTLDPAIEALQAQVNMLATQVALNDQAAQNEVDRAANDLREQILTYVPSLVGFVAAASALAGVLAYFGIDLVFKKTLEAHIEDRITKGFNEAWFRVDPRSRLVWVPRTGFEQGTVELVRSGFKLDYYDVDAIPTEGLVVYVVSEDDPNAEKRLQGFLSTANPSPRRLGLLVYITGRLDQETFDLFPSLITSQMIGTLVSHLVSLARMVDEGTSGH